MEQGFEDFRKLYPGTKRGYQTEFDNFKKKHKDWKEVIPLLLPAVSLQKIHKEELRVVGAFVPSWKHMQTWINQRCWEEEPGEIVKSKEDRRGADTWYE